MEHDEMPAPFLVVRSPAEIAAVARWWMGLSPETRDECRRLWDPRADDPAATCDASGETPAWHTLPIQLAGRLVDEETRRETRIGKQELFDYIVNHEDVSFFLKDPPRRHMCRSHAAARDVIANGLLPSGFRCPLDRRDCPMRGLLAGANGKSIEFVPVLALRG